MYVKYALPNLEEFLKSWLPGVQIQLVRNPDYKQLRGDAINKGQAYCDRVVLTVISEESVAEAALESGELSAAISTAAAASVASARAMANDRALSARVTRPAPSAVFRHADFAERVASSRSLASRM